MQSNTIRAAVKLSGQIDAAVSLNGDIKVSVGTGNPVYLYRYRDPEAITNEELEELLK